MLSGNPLLFRLFIIASYVLLFFVFLTALQDSDIYFASLGKFAPNYSNTPEGILSEYKPFEKPDSENFIRWDAGHYNTIRNSLYDAGKAGGEYICAFFPMFPLIWKILGVSAPGMAILNFAIFCFSLLVLISLFEDDSFNNSPLYFPLIFALPSIAPFLIPYTEAVLFAFMTIAFTGLIKNKYWLWFAGMMAVAMTRPTIVIVLCSFFCTDIYFLAGHRNFRLFFSEFFKKSLPMIAGTFLVMIIQLAYGHPLFTFVSAQKYWGHYLGLPGPLKDWSHEQFSMNLFVMCVVIPPILIFITGTFFLKLNNTRKPAISIFSKDREFIKKYIWTLSCVYITGIFCYILLYHGGSLNGLFRYTLATPFFYALVIISFVSKDRLTEGRNRYILPILTLFLLLVFLFNGYSHKFTFSLLGMPLLTAFVWLYIYIEKMPRKYAVISLCLYFLISILWSCYLLNVYLADGWLFT